MSKIADAEANATSLDGLVNDNALVPTLRNGPKPSWQYIVDQVYAQLGYAVAGSFVDGFTYTGIRQVGADASGNTWIYTGGEQNLPHVVLAGTVPSAPDYFQVSVNSADNVVLDNGENLQQAIDRLNVEADNLDADSVSIDGGGTVQDFVDIYSPTINEKGASLDGITDDSASVSLALNESSPLKTSNVESETANLYGSDIAPNSLMQDNVTGRLFNPKSSLNNYFFGQETLQHWFSLFSGASNKSNGNAVTAKIVCTGDSTTFGVGGTYGGVPAILQDMAKTRGYPNVTVVNRGRSGMPTINWPEKTSSWENNYLNSDIADDPDLYIIRWGANDPFYNITPVGDSNGTMVETRDEVLKLVIDGYRRVLTTLRNTAGMDVDNLSVIIATPGPMNDVFFGRDEVYFQRLSIALKQMALDFQCAFIDIYGLFSNSWGGVGKWMDSDGTSGTQRAVHPHNELYEHIAGAIGELALPDYGFNWKVNSVRNTSGTTVNRLTTEAPNLFFAGVNIDRMGSGVGSTLGKPYNGAVTTIKQADGAVAQFNYPLKGLGAGMSARFGFGSFNDYWNGAIYKISESGYANGWSDIGGSFEVGSCKLSLSGTVELSGVLSVGTTTNGTTIFTLPAGFRPSKTVLCLVATELNDCLVSINTSGTVSITRFSGGGSYITLNNVKFPVY